MKSKRWFVAGLMIGCLAGFLFGSYLEYTRVTANKQRELLGEYRYARDHFHLTDAEMADFGKQVPQYFEDMTHQDRTAAAYALNAFRDLAKGNIEDTKRDLLRPIGSYYQIYHKAGGDPDIIAEIEKAAKEYPEIAAVIAEKK